MITAENYFSKENNLKYFGSTQYKTFAECESQGYALGNGLYEIEKTDSMMVGSYVDAHFEGTLDLFKAQNPSLFKRDGSLKSGFISSISTNLS